MCVYTRRRYSIYLPYMVNTPLSNTCQYITKPSVRGLVDNDVMHLQLATWYTDAMPYYNTHL